MLHVALASLLLFSPLDDLWNFDDPAASEAAFRRAVASATAPAGSAEALTQVARAQGLQRRFREADATLDSAAALIGPGPSRARVRLLLERGRVLNSSGKAAASRPVFEQALAAANAAHEEALAVDAAHMLGIVVPGDAGLAWDLRALAMAEGGRSPEARKWRASLYNNIGWAYHDKKQYAQALAMFEKAVPLRARAGQRAPLLEARWAVARAKRSLSRTAEALAEQRALAAEHARAGTSDGYVDEEIGECLLALGRKAEAAPSFRRAYEALAKDPSLLAGERPRLERLRALAGATAPLPPAPR